MSHRLHFFATLHSQVATCRILIPSVNLQKHSNVP